MLHDAACTGQTAMVKLLVDDFHADLSRVTMLVGWKLCALLSGWSLWVTTCMRACTARLACDMPGPHRLEVHGSVLRVCVCVS
jgi:hypothetical protein